MKQKIEDRISELENEVSELEKKAKFLQNLFDETATRYTEINGALKEDISDTRKKELEKEISDLEKKAADIKKEFDEINIKHISYTFTVLEFNKILEDSDK